MGADRANKGRRTGGLGRSINRSTDDRSRRSSGGIVSPPRYPRRAHKMEHFGDSRSDPFYWLRDRRDPKVRRLLQRENAYMDSVFAAHGGDQLCRTLFNEMRARWKENNASLPYRDRGYWYFTRTLPNADHPIFCRRPFTEQTAGFMHEAAEIWSRNPLAPLPPYDDEVVYLDMNLLVKELRLSYVDMGDMEVSSDEQHLALLLDCGDGGEVYTVFLLEITDVNYARWLNEQSEVHRAWAEAMVRSDQSIYTAPVSGLLAHQSPKTPAGSGNSTHTKKKSKKHAAPHSSFSSLAPLLTTTPTTSTPTTSSPQRVEPTHKITRRIDVFDAADEVLWLSPTSLLYLGMDEKMRSHRVIYHNLSTPVDAEQTDIICYEESDEAFWVSSFSFTADGRFAMFTVASNTYTEVYVIPCDAGVGRSVSGVPVFHTAATEEGEEFQMKVCKVHCFTDRTSRMDYDIDHHSSLFGEGLGAWVVTITSAPSGPEDFQVAYVLDGEEMTCHTGSGAARGGGGNQTLSDPSIWRPLFTRDPCITVEGVECTRDYLLLGVGRAASSTVLLLPVRVLWDRWRDCRGKNMSPLSLQDDTVDLRHVVCRLSHSPGEARFPVDQLLQEQRRKKDNNPNADEEGYVSRVTNSAVEVSFNTRTWLLVVTHLTIPTVFIECTLEGEGDTLCMRHLFQAGVGGKPYNADEYDATVLWVPSNYAFGGGASTPLPRPLPTKEPAAEVRIPVYLCWKKALRCRGENPMLLTVYGSYGECCDVVFEKERLALLDRGFVWAVAGVRGGGEFGITWHDAGRRLQRATSVNDFVSVSCYVQETGWCAAGQLVTHGSSAGGFVVTAAMCAAPSLPLAVIAAVPFVDCLTTLMDDSLPLTICEWEEFGNPRDDADAYRLLRAMSPMDNIPPAGVALPHVLLLTAWHDTRVGYWESLAFTARLRAREEEEEEGDASTERRVILHHCNFDAGHNGSSGRYERLKETAREYAFVLLIQQANNAAPRADP